MTAEIHDEGPEDGWQPARLIPTSGIKGADEQERRATSAPHESPSGRSR